MDKELHIVDMSPAIYAGSFNKRAMISADVVPTADGWREMRIPCGGASMLFNIISQYLPRGEMCFVADRRPTIKQEIYSGYKGNRKHNPEVQINKEVAEYILSDCGFTIYARDGYEADDIIANIVRQQHDNYDRLYVHTADSDLYLLVDDKVSILPATSKAKTVTRENYEYTVNSQRDTAYNTVVFDKFLRGDPGKNITAMEKNSQAVLRRAICPTPASLVRAGDFVFFLGFIKRFYPQLLDRATLFYPLPMDEQFVIGNNESVERIKEWAYEIGNRKIQGKKGDLSKQFAELLSRSLYIDE